VNLFLPLLAASTLGSVGAEGETQTIETVAGTGRPELNALSGKALEVNINQPFGVEFGPDGALYICEVGNHRVLRLDLARS
jgi:streptogramin lyase